MTNPRVLVSAGRLQTGGGANVLRGLVAQVFSQLPAEFIVVCREDAARTLEANGHNVTLVYQNSWPGHLLFSSAIREQLLVHRLAEEHKCDLILGIGSAGVLFPPCPQVLILMNRLYFSKEYSQRAAALSYLYSIRLRSKGLFLRYSMKHCALLMTESESMKRLICRSWGISPSQIEVLHKGVNASVVARPTSQTQWSGEEAVILCVSHFAIHKGFETLVTAAVRLERMGVKFGVWIAGDFDESHWGGGIQAKAKRRFDLLLETSGVKQYFRFLGSLSGVGLADAYRQADLCVFPSWCESYPNPIPEALANGIPIVAADTDTNHELAGEAALYFPPEDPSTLAELIAFVIGSRAARRSLSERAMGRAKEFSWSRTADDLWKGLRRAAPNGKVPISLFGSG